MCGFGVMRVQQLIVANDNVGWFKRAFHKIQNVPQNGAAFYTRQEYVKDGTDPSCVRAPCGGLVIVVPHSCKFL